MRTPGVLYSHDHAGLHLIFGPLAHSESSHRDHVNSVQKNTISQVGLNRQWQMSISGIGVGPRNFPKILIS